MYKEYSKRYTYVHGTDRCVCVGKCFTDLNFVIHYTFIYSIDIP